MEAGFIKADSTNLPQIDTMAIAKFFASNPDLCSAEFRNVKTSLSGRKSYGDDAIGYVQLKRDQQTCIIKCKICPEHKLRSKPYAVTLIVDEQEADVNSVQCHNCRASRGICKHSIAFLMWCHRRSEEPSCTSVECYWKKSNLAKVGSSTKILTTKEMVKRKQHSLVVSDSSSVMQSFVMECRKRKINTCQFIRHEPDFKEKRVNMLSLHYLMCTFNTGNQCDIFLSKITNIFNDINLRNVQKQTKNQFRSQLWYELRYGRITASKCYDVSRCKTVDGTLVATILGARTPETPAIKRGKKLEDEVKKAVEKN